MLAVTGGVSAVSPARAILAVLMPLVAATAIHFMPRARVEPGRFEKNLFLVDALLLAGVLAVTPASTVLAVSLFGLVLFAGLMGDRSKALAAVLVALAVYLVSGFGSFSLSGQDLLAGVMTPALTIVAAGFYFGALGERISGETTLVARARRESAQLWALLEITDTVTRSLDLKQVMTQIVNWVGKLAGSRSCSILLAEDSHEHGFVVASSDRPDVDMLEIEIDKYPEIRKALETREPVVIDDVQSDPVVEPVRDVLLEKGYRAVLVLPLMFGREVLGCLFLRTRRETPFTPAEIRFCKVAAGASANALKNALLYRDVADEAEKLRATGETLRSILDGSPDLIVATDTAGSIREFNHGAERLIGLSSETVVGRRLTDVIPMECKRGPEALSGEEGIERSEVRIEGADGQLEMDLITAPLHDARGETSGKVWIGRDVTRLRQAERSLVQAERLSSLGQVVAGVAHELNNPLSGVVGYAELLRQEASPSQERDLERILVSARRCQKIVMNLLSFSRKHPPEKKWNDLNDCLRGLLELKEYQLRSARVEVQLELDPHLPQTSFDYHQIEQVVLNLLNNAEQAIQGTGEPGVVIARTLVRNGRVCLEIEDSGPGVSEEVRDKIFDPFFTTKGIGEGTGLGLSLSYGILQEHGGEILVRNTERGACFEIALPISGAPIAEVIEDEVSPSREDDSPFHGMRVLVAEDEPVVLDLFSRILREDGAEVILARDGEEAWQRLEGTEFDLVVADIRMPRMDGQRLYELVAEERPELLRRFVFATGDMVRQDTVRFLEGLPNRILTKPLQVETVRRVLNQALASSK